MGCWNGTCMISKLPINYGDEIKLVILNSGSIYNTSSGFCYPDDLMKPIFLPITGTYNDYGMIENIVKDYNYDIIEKFFKGRFESIRNDSGEKSEFGLIDILDGIERERLEDEDGQDIKISFVMIHSKIYDKITTEFKGQYWNDKEEYLDEAKTERKYYLTIDEWVDNNYIEGAKAKSEKDLENLDLSKLTGRDIYGTDISPNIFNYRLIEKWMLYSEFFVSISKAEYDLHINDIKDFLKLKSFMNETRSSWMVQSGQGSQSECYDSYKILTDSINEVISYEKSKSE